MPCWEVNLINVEFKVGSRVLLDKAIEALGLTAVEYGGRLRLSNGIRLDLNSGQATVQEGQQTGLNALKIAYSKESLKLVAKQNGWQVQWQGNKGSLLKGSL